MRSRVEVSIVMPCLNEARTLGACIREAQDGLRKAGLAGEVIVADNGSNDGSQQIATELGARVVDVKDKGYGFALRGGIEAAKGAYVIMGDSDDSYDFRDAPKFVAKLREGFDLVMGNRFRGGIDPGAMPILNRYVGNPILTGILNLFFKSGIGDAHCGLRGFTKAAYQRMALITTGMEFASEMIVKASLMKMRIAEIPTRLHKDGRDRPPHLRPFRDGWRHLRFLLLMSPTWLYLVPAFIIAAIGATLMVILTFGTLTVGGAVLEAKSMVAASQILLTGIQIAWFWAFSSAFAWRIGLTGERLIERYGKVFTLERGAFAGVALIVTGIVFMLVLVGRWQSIGFGPFESLGDHRLTIWAGTLTILGVQTLFGSFLLSMLAMRAQTPRQHHEAEEFSPGFERKSA